MNNIKALAKPQLHYKHRLLSLTTIAMLGSVLSLPATAGPTDAIESLVDTDSLDNHSKCFGNGFAHRRTCVHYGNASNSPIVVSVEKENGDADRDDCNFDHGDWCLPHGEQVVIMPGEFKAVLMFDDYTYVTFWDESEFKISVEFLQTDANHNVGSQTNEIDIWVKPDYKAGVMDDFNYGVGESIRRGDWELWNPSEGIFNTIDVVEELESQFPIAAMVLSSKLSTSDLIRLQDGNYARDEPGYRVTLGKPLLTGFQSLIYDDSFIGIFHTLEAESPPVQTPPPMVKLYVDEGFDSSVTQVPVTGNFTSNGNMQGIHDQISSLIVPDGYSITLYEDFNFRGDEKTYTGAVNSLKNTGFNDKASSFRIQALPRLVPISIVPPLIQVLF